MLIARHLAKGHIELAYIFGTDVCFLFSAIILLDCVSSYNLLSPKFLTISRLVNSMPTMPGIRMQAFLWPLNLWPWRLSRPETPSSWSLHPKSRCVRRWCITRPGSCHQNNRTLYAKHWGRLLPVGSYLQEKQSGSNCVRSDDKGSCSLQC